jgi:hypothetical protein
MAVANVLAVSRRVPRTQRIREHFRVTGTAAARTHRTYAFAQIAVKLTDRGSPDDHSRRWRCERVQVRWTHTFIGWNGSSRDGRRGRRQYGTRREIVWSYRPAFIPAQVV